MRTLTTIAMLACSLPILAAAGGAGAACAAPREVGASTLEAPRAYPATEDSKGPAAREADVAAPETGAEAQETEPAGRDAEPAADGTEPPKKNALEMETYLLVILVKGPDWTSDRTPELLRLQQQHMMHIRQMARSGRLVAAGPLAEDGYERGVLLFKDTPMAVARQMTEDDPMIKAGRLKAQFHTWMVQKGMLR